jgi:hypothetical protein
MNSKETTDTKSSRLTYKSMFGDYGWCFEDDGETIKARFLGDLVSLRIRRKANDPPNSHKNPVFSGFFCSGMYLYRKRPDGARKDV